VALSFRPEDRDKVARGELTVTYRLWARAHVRAGRTYDTGFGTVTVDAVDVIPAAMIPRSDIPLTGFNTLDEIWRSAGDHKGVEVTGDTLLYRVQFRFIS
jgi:hypothetical protein